MLENYRCSQSAGLSLIKSDIYLLTLFFNTRILLLWVICPTTELFSCRQHRCTRCQHLPSAPAYGHHACGDDKGLIHIDVILLQIQRMYIESRFNKNRQRFNGVRIMKQRSIALGGVRKRTCVYTLYVHFR